MKFIKRHYDQFAAGMFAIGFTILLASFVMSAIPETKEYANKVTVAGLVVMFTPMIGILYYLLIWTVINGKNED